MALRILPLSGLPVTARLRAAQIVWEALHETAPSIAPDLRLATVAVEKAVADCPVLRVLLDETETIQGLATAAPLHAGSVWQVMLLALAPPLQRQGHGRAMIVDLEHQVRARGAQTLWVSLGDERSQTSMANIDPFPDLLLRLIRIRNLKNHPYEFFQKCGFQLAGLVPAARGRGAPDIMLAKQL